MSDESIERILLLCLGWLLGLLGPVIVDGIRRRRENALGKRAIHAELRDLAHKLALAAQFIYMRKGRIDRKHIEWLKSHLESYAGLIDTSPIMESLRLQLSWDDSELKAYADKTKASTGKNVTLQKYSVPLLDARVSALWSFETSIQRRLLRIRTDIELLNDIVDRSRHYSDMTFSKHEGRNFEIIINNLEQTYDLYFERAKAVVDQVAELGSIE